MSFPESGVFEVVFFCNAGSDVGFGHLRRSLDLAAELNSRGVQVLGLTGQFDADARQLIEEETYGLHLLAKKESWNAEVAVVDYMFDCTDMGTYDDALIRYVGERARRTILISSANQIPSDLPVDLAVGHMLSPDQETGYTLKTGLAYAPVPTEFQEHIPKAPTVREDIRRVLVALGNSEDPGGFEVALRGLEKTDFGGRVDVLLPPALVEHKKSFSQVNAGSDIQFYHNVPTVIPLLQRADCMIGSYGNLTFEALALGLPVIVIGIKRFMVEYAESMANDGLLVVAGHVDELEPKDIEHEFRNLDSVARYRMAKNAISTIDARGLDRIAGLIQGRLP